MTLTTRHRRLINPGSDLVPAHRAVVRAVLTDLDGRALILLPAKPGRYWHLPGGKVEVGESPRAACRRELAEEIGIDVSVTELLVSAWNPDPVLTEQDWLSYLFDGGIHDADQFGRRVVLQPSEIRDWQWAAPGEAMTLLEPGLARLLLAARSHTRYPEYSPQELRQR